MPDRIERTSNFKIKINGQDLPDALANDIIAVEVDLCLNLPGMFVIDIFDPQVSLAADAKFELGNSVSVGMEVDREEGERATEILIKGEITAVEAVFDFAAETRLRIRGYDKGHRLHRVQKTRAFTNVTDSDVIKTLVSENRLTAEISSTSVVHDHIYQFRQTDFEFIRERARRNGYVCLVDDTKLKCKPPAGIGSDGPELKYGVELLYFTPRLTTGGQVSEVTVRGWDYKNKEAVVSTISSPSFSYHAGSSRNGGATAQSAFADPGKVLLHNLPVQQASEADKIAKAILDEREASFLQGEGQCYGNPKIKAGMRLTLTGLGSLFNGKYFVTRATHRFTRVHGYRTEIAVAGVGTNMLADLLGTASDMTIEPTRRLDGVVPAIVTNNNDENNLGRIKVKFPTIDDQLDSWWIPIAQPLAGPKTGWWLIPKVDDEVLVAFENGDFNRPYVVGSLWNGKDTPPLDGPATDRRDQMHLLQTEKEFQLKFDDKEERIEIKTKDGYKLLLDQKNKKIELTTEDAHSLVLDQRGKKADLSVPSGIKMTMDGNGPGKFEVAGPGGTKMTMDGAGGAVTLEGSSKVTVKASGQVQVEGSGPVTIKGAMVNIN
jgi:Rhs element Vgr protein